MSQEITLYDKIQDPIEAAIRFGEHISKSQLFGCTKQEQGTVLALTCFFEKRSPLDIKRRYHITQSGDLIQKALAQLADFRGKGGKYKWINTAEIPQAKDEDWKAVLELSYDGQTLTASYSIADAKRQQLSFKPGSNWVKTPANMLRARAITNGLGMVCPEIISGSEDEDSKDDALDKPLLPSQSATVTTDKPDKKKANAAAAPIDVQATVKQDDSHPDLKPATAPVTTPADAKPFKAEADGNGKLTTATVQALQAAIGAENAEVADKWFLKMGWIKTTGGYFDIPAKKAQMFLDNPAKALNTMKAQVGAK